MRYLSAVVIDETLTFVAQPLSQRNQARVCRSGRMTKT